MQVRIICTCRRRWVGGWRSRLGMMMLRMVSIVHTSNGAIRFANADDKSGRFESPIRRPRSSTDEEERITTTELGRETLGYTADGPPSDDEYCARSPPVYGAGFGSCVEEIAFGGASSLISGRSPGGIRIRLGVNMACTTPQAACI